MTARGKYFLPYQADWLRDESRFKIWEKSRRIGATFVQSYEDVKDASRDEGAMDVWFTSADITAAKEYIGYSGKWARILSIAAEDLGEVVIDAERDIKALVIQLANGKRINALSSRPEAFRSKGGKLVVDEFAFHADPERLWKAAMPIITWGYPVRVLSTYNGKGNKYYRLVQDAEAGKGVKGAKSRWSLHSTPIQVAVAQGLADRIRGRALTEAERAEFIDECRDIAGDEESFLQEYCCEPVDEATAWLPWALISSVEDARAGKPELYQGGDCYVGMDIARRRDLTVIWVIEMVGDIAWTREVVRMKAATFAAQDAELARVMDAYRVRRLCVDQGGMGEKPVEDAKTDHGRMRVEGVIFTPTIKQHLAQLVKEAFEDRTSRIPEDKDIRNSHHAVRKVTTVAGNTRFDADHSEVGHADEFWAHALALHAAEGTSQPSAGASVEAQEGDYKSERASRGRLVKPPTDNSEQKERRHGRLAARERPRRGQPRG